MFWLSRRTSDGERGAAATLVALVLGAGVLLGMGALVVDVGRLYVEREELQSGADAAALALAEVCGRERELCAGQANEAREYAGRNAKDRVSAVTVICGRGPGLPGCPDPAPNLTGCIGDAPESFSYVEVRTSTEMVDGATLLPPAFARMLTGQEGYEGTRVGACARAAWGSPASAEGLGITFSYCEWLKMTGDGTQFYTGTGTPPASMQRTVRLKDSQGQLDCDASPPGGDAPGGFGWVDGADDDCHALVSLGTYGGDQSPDAPKGCETFLPTVSLSDNRVANLVPVYDTVTGQGHVTYTLKGFAAFIITGYKLNGQLKRESWLTNDHPCDGPSQERCIYGYFTRALITTPGRVGGPDLGGSIVSLVG
jgi:hypothetical protein